MPYVGLVEACYLVSVYKGRVRNILERGNGTFLWCGNPAFKIYIDRKFMKKNLGLPRTCE